jgi:transcriptional regulator with XRE-family HTH domain
MRIPKIADAVENLRRRFIGEDPKRAASLEEERVNAQVARTIRELRQDAGLTQKELAELIGTTQSVISRLEDADYEGHSLSMLDRIARALNQRVRVSTSPATTKQARTVATASPVSVINTTNDLNVGWADFVRIISSQDGRLLADGGLIPVFDKPDGNSYLQEVEACQRAFRTSASFEEMPLNERQRVSGWGNLTTGYFGSMKGAGRFMRITHSSPRDLSVALDHVPLDGDVTPANARDCLKAATHIEGVGMAGATRLLTMKRPDRFLSANGASLQKISKVYRIRADDIDSYLRIIEETWNFPWASAPEPVHPTERRLWRTRVALLDAIFYEPPAKP